MCTVRNVCAPHDNGGPTRSQLSAMRHLFYFLTAAALAFSGATAANPYYDPAKPHHTRDGFRNNYIAQVNKPVGDLLRWRLQAWRDNLPPPPDALTETVLPELARLQSNGAAGRQPPSVRATAPMPSATWIGHATVLMQTGGLNVLTDPVFSDRASPVQFVGPLRAQPPGIALKDLPPIDVVLISHNHYDHLDRISVLLLNERAQGKTLFLVPLGIKPWLARIGITNVVELDWWEAHVHAGVAFNLTPVQHWSARSLNDRSKTLWGGWAVFAPDFHWYFSGDTGYSKDFSDTRAHFSTRYPDGGIDLALLAIGAYEPRWFMQDQHINPTEAVQAHKDLGAGQSLGIHWGTFNLSDEPLDQAPKDLAAARIAQGVSEADFFMLKIGETRWLPRRSPTVVARQPAAATRP